ncbi:hypothetical protein [Phenylobacterium sp.]|uniref:hypothetical protein n=1 Tax=Phenylobacterium sp. TaxID=1871053 RepID=UPI00391CC738
MLSVIIDARGDAQKLPALLAQLTAGAVEGLVKEVFIVAEPSDLVTAICDDTGAEDTPSMEGAIAWTKGEVLAVLPADLRLRDGWVEALGGFLAGGGRGAVIEGLERGGLFRDAPRGVLVERAAVVGLNEPDLKRLRAKLGFRPPRAG